jgi:hypothetical protein
MEPKARKCLLALTQNEPLLSQFIQALFMHVDKANEGKIEPLQAWAIISDFTQGVEQEHRPNFDNFQNVFDRFDSEACGALGLEQI